MITSRNNHNGQRLAGDVIVVTGAISAIGAACVDRLSEEGAVVIATDYKCENPEIVLPLHKDQVFYLNLDVTNENKWIQTLDHIVDQHGTLDGLVNNAETFGHADNIDQGNQRNFNRIIKGNLDGIFLGCKHAVKRMKKFGGSIVNMSSIFGSVGGGGSVAYAASKGGVLMATRSIARYCLEKDYPIRCNTIQSGSINSTSNGSYLQAGFDEVNVSSCPPIGRLGHPREVANLALYLLSDESSFVNGTEYIVDGGRLA